MDFTSRRSKAHWFQKPSARSVHFNALSVPATLCLLFVVGCSSTHSSLTSGSPHLKNVLLKGNYVYTLGGSFSGVTGGSCNYCVDGPFQRAGTFVSDGNGHITNGSDEFVQGPTPVTNTLTGSYAIADDGTGIMLLAAGSAQLELAFAIASDSSVSWIEFDSFASGAGGARSQDTAAMTSLPSGTFVFHTHSSQSNSGSQGSISSVGQLMISSGSITGREDVMRAGVFSSLTVTGTLTAPDATGTGTLTLTDSLGFGSTFSYYVIDSNALNLMETDTAVVNGQIQPVFGTGRAEIQSKTAFDNSSLQGGFVFSSTGEAQSTTFSVVTVGAFTADGNGNIVSGSYDSVLNGVPISNAAIAGTYGVSPAGRATISLNSQAVGVPSIPQIAWLVNSSRAFILVDIPGRVEDGAMNQQTSSSFSQTSLSGPFSISMFGGDAFSPSQVDRVGVATFDGKTTLTFTDYFVNRGGGRNQTNSPGVTYTVSPNGRVTASVDGLTNALVMYLTSNNTGSLILEDPDTEVAGGVTQQTSP